MQPTCSTVSAPQFSEKLRLDDVGLKSLLFVAACKHTACDIDALAASSTTRLHTRHGPLCDHAQAEESQACGIQRVPQLLCVSCTCSLLGHHWLNVCLQQVLNCNGIPCAGACACSSPDQAEVVSYDVLAEGHQGLALGCSGIILHETSIPVAIHFCGRQLAAGSEQLPGSSMHELT